MAERNKLASIPGQPLPERKGNFLSDLWDEASGAFARYGRRSGAQRDASLAMLNQAVAPGTDPLTGAGMKALGLAGLVTHPLAFFPTREEWDQRLQAAGNDSRIGRSIGGFLSDLPSLIDPQMAAGGAVLATAPLAAKMAKPGLGKGLGDLLQDAANNKELDALGARLQAEAAQVGGSPSTVSREQALQGLVGGAEDAGIIAYHGSPHSFDRFDMSKIGTGEGAQAYGHGLYFAEAEGVADDYRKTLGGKGLDVRKVVEKHYPDAPLSEEATAAIYSAATNGKPDPKDAAKSVQMRVAALRDTGQSFMDGPGEKGQKLAAAISDIREIQRGSMYQVKINVKPDELLDWDKPLSEQPKNIAEAALSIRNQAALEDYKRRGTPQHLVDEYIGSANRRAIEGNMTGGSVVKVMKENGLNAAATEKLRAAGVKGIKYKDAGSRDGAGGTYNYVVFDDKLITILKKYGIPMTAGAGGAMMVAGQDMPPELASQMGGT